MREQPETPPPFALVGLDHLVLRVADLERSLAFYRDALGCPVEKAVPELGLYHVRAGRCLIDLTPVNGKLGAEGGGLPGAEGRNLDHFCLQLAPFDRETVTAHLAAHGIAIDAEGERFGAEGDGWSIYVFDPDGNRVELKGAKG